MKNDSGKGWKKRSLHAFSRCHNGNDAAKKGGRGWREKEGREGALSRWCTSEIPMLFSLLPRFTFPGITDNASYCSWMLFLRSIRIQLRNFIFLKRFRLFTHAHPSLPTLSSISLSPVSKQGDVKAFALKHQLSTYFQKSDFYVHLGETFDRSVSVDVERK